MIQLSRSFGITVNATHRWQSKFGGMEVSEAKRLEELSTVFAERAGCLFSANDASPSSPHIAPRVATMAEDFCRMRAHARSTIGEAML